MNQQLAAEADASDHKTEGGVATVAPPKSRQQIMRFMAVAERHELGYLKGRQLDAAIALSNPSKGEPYLAKLHNWRCAEKTPSFEVPEAVIDGEIMTLTTQRGELKTTNPNADLSVRNLMHNGEVLLYWEELLILMEKKTDFITALI